MRTVIPFPNINHLKIIIVSIFILLTGLQEGVSQPSKLDSLLQVVSKEKDPKIKCDKYIAYIAGISSLNRDSAITLLTQAAIDYQKTVQIRGWPSNFSKGLVCSFQLQV